MTDDISPGEAQALIRAIVSLASMADRALPADRSGLHARLSDHLGVSESIPNTSMTFDLIERANLQLALDELRTTSAVWEEIGVTPDIGNYSGVSLASFADGSWRGPGAGARQYMSVEVSATDSIKCLRSGIVLATFGGVPVAVLFYATDRHQPCVQVEIAAATQEIADRLLEHLRTSMAEHNVLRGKVLTFAYGEYGGFGLGFTTVPTVTREQVILPEWQLDAIEAHTVGMSALAVELVAAGQHLKRGLLLYGPPGTGKTHTVSYLIGQMAERTTIILSGASVGAIGQAGGLARKLAPATIVIEDVDLIGMDRELPGGEHNPMLFQLLNEMDGLGSSDDVVFILTTNRASLLEPALAARPGRVDQAVEIGLPDAEGRRQLFGLYLPGEVAPTALDDAVARTAGASAAYIKELSRRAALITLTSATGLGEALTATIDHMDRTATPLLRRALAATPEVPSAG